MSETIFRRSSAGTPRLMAASTRLTSSSVFSIRVPDWARTMTRNYPASVIGNSSCPSRG